jgi:hypothetical protein
MPKPGHFSLCYMVSNLFGSGNITEKTYTV